jgi:hypothetical protein
LTIDRANQVWCADITYIPISRGLLYLVAIMEWAILRRLAQGEPAGTVRERYFLSSSASSATFDGESRSAVQTHCLLMVLGPAFYRAFFLAVRYVVHF